MINKIFLFTMGAFAFFAFLYFVDNGFSQENPQEGIDCFIEACRNYGGNPTLIKSMYIEFIKKESYGDTPEDLLKIKEKEMEKSLRAYYQAKNLSQKEVDSRIQEENIPAIVRASVQEQKWDYRVLLKVDDTIHHNVRTNARRWDSNFQKWGGQAVTLFFRGDAEVREKAKCISIDEYGQYVEVSDSAVYIEPVQGFGRIQGVHVFAALLGLTDGRTDYSTFDFPTSNIIRYKEMLSNQKQELGHIFYEFAGEVKYDNDGNAVILQSSIDGKVTECYWIDSSRGYICPLIQTFNPSNGFIIEEYKSVGFFQQQESGLWYPELFTRRSYDPISGKIRKHTEYIIDKSTLQINQPISDDEFTLDIQIRERILDVRDNKRIPYRAIKDGSLSLKSIELDELGFLHRGPDMPQLILEEKQLDNKEINEIILQRTEQFREEERIEKEKLRLQWEKDHVQQPDQNNENDASSVTPFSPNWMRIPLFLFGVIFLSLGIYLNAVQAKKKK